MKDLFKWDVLDLAGSQMNLNLLFDNPLEVSQNAADLLLIEFDASED